MTDLTWYSRLFIWIGAGVVLVESVTGRGVGPVTVLAVLMMGIGLPVFLAGLYRDSRAAQPALDGEVALAAAEDAQVESPAVAESERAASAAHAETGVGAAGGPETEPAPEVTAKDSAPDAEQPAPEPQGGPSKP